MKFIFVAVFVGAFALSFSSGFHTDFQTPFFRRLAFKDKFNGYAIVRKERIDFTSRFGYLVGKQYFDTQTAILEAWRQCDQELFLYPLFDKSLDIFANPILGDTQSPTRHDKCLYYCMMNRTGVLTDEGFQEEKYMAIIRQLRFNYTSSYDHEDMTTRQAMSDTINNLAGHLNIYLMYKTYPRSLNDMIESYAQAAHECQGYRLSKEMDDCDKGNFILWCMMARNQRNGLNSPFYPLWLKDYWDPD